MFIPSGIELGKELESALVLPCSKHELFIRDKIVLLNPGNPLFQCFYLQVLLLLEAEKPVLQLFKEVQSLISFIQIFHFISHLTACKLLVNSQWIIWSLQSRNQVSPISGEAKPWVLFFLNPSSNWTHTVILKSDFWNDLIFHVIVEITVVLRLS